MASIEAARKNNLNDRARKVGQPDQLSTQDIDTIIEFYDFTCLKCGKKPANSPDHVIPLSKGGTNTLDNLQLLCLSCNKSKGDDETEYRQDNVCPNSLHQEQADKRQYRKHDWNAIRLEYITSNLSLRELADKFDMIPTLLFKRSTAGNWNKQRQDHWEQLGIKLVAAIDDKAIEQAAEKELELRSALFDVIEAAIESWRHKPKATAGELAQLMRLGMVAKGMPTDRMVTTDESASKSALLRELTQILDGAATRESERDYAPIGDNPSSGWTD
jgi:hypothetical protein